MRGETGAPSAVPATPRVSSCAMRRRGTGGLTVAAAPADSGGRLGTCRGGVVERGGECPWPGAAAGPRNPCVAQAAACFSVPRARSAACGIRLRQPGGAAMAQVSTHGERTMRQPASSRPSRSSTTAKPGRREDAGRRVPVHRGHDRGPEDRSRRSVLGGCGPGPAHPRGAVRRGPQHVPGDRLAAVLLRPFGHRRPADRRPRRQRARHRGVADRRRGDDTHRDLRHDLRRAVARVGRLVPGGDGTLLWMHHVYGSDPAHSCAVTDVSIRVEADGREVVTSAASTRTVIQAPVRRVRSSSRPSQPQAPRGSGTASSAACRWTARARRSSSCTRPCCPQPTTGSSASPRSTSITRRLGHLGILLPSVLDGRGGAGGQWGLLRGRSEVESCCTGRVSLAGRCGMSPEIREVSMRLVSFSASPLLRFSASPLLRFSASPCM